MGQPTHLQPRKTTQKCNSCCGTFSKQYGARIWNGMRHTVIGAIATACSVVAAWVGLRTDLCSSTTHRLLASLLPAVCGFVYFISCFCHSNYTLLLLFEDLRICCCCLRIVGLMFDKVSFEIISLASVLSGCRFG